MFKDFLHSLKGLQFSKDALAHPDGDTNPVNGTVGVLMVGYGYWSPNLIRNIRKIPGFRFVGVCEKDESRHQKIRDEHPDAAVYLHYRDAFASPDVHAVVVSTAASSHYRIAKMALQNGKHVLVEKPLALSTVDALELLALARERKLVLMVDHTFLYSMPIRRLREEVNAGTLGIPLLFESLRLNLGLFQRDISVVWDLAPHDVSLYLFLLSRPVTHVSAHGAVTLIHPAHEEPYHSNASIHLYENDELLGTIMVSWMSPVKMRRLTIVGTERMAVYDQLDQEAKLKIHEKSVKVASSEGGNTQMFDYQNGPATPVPVEEKEDLETMLLDFYNAVTTGKPPVSTGALGAQVVSVLEAAHKSLKAGGRKIPV